jgi:hypothetical protein
MRAYQRNLIAQNAEGARSSAMCQQAPAREAPSLMSTSLSSQAYSLTALVLPAESGSPEDLPTEKRRRLGQLYRPVVIAMITMGMV